MFEKPPQPDEIGMKAYSEALIRGTDEEGACKAALSAIQRDAIERGQFWVARLSSIIARRPPQLITLPDGGFVFDKPGIRAQMGPA